MDSFLLQFVREPLSRADLAAMMGDGWIEFDSMINVRPAQGNRSRGVDDEAACVTIRRIVSTLVSDA